MRIEIFVVTTELNKIDAESFDKKNRIEAYLKLIRCKTDLIKLFGGLTEKTDYKGYWINSKGKIESDSEDLWLIYTTQTKIAQHGDKLSEILLRIKQITKQKSQAYTINNEMYCV